MVAKSITCMKPLKTYLIWLFKSDCKKINYLKLYALRTQYNIRKYEQITGEYTF